MQATCHDLFTVSGAARELRVSEATIRRRVARGELECMRSSTGDRLFEPRVVERAAKREAARKRA